LTCLQWECPGPDAYEAFRMLLAAKQAANQAQV
jgi:hypothetical protein